jgi:hypothetical protein
MIKTLKANLTTALLMISLITLSLTIINIHSVQAEEPLSIDVQITETGEYTQIEGIVTDSQQTPVEGAAVSIQVEDPSGNTIHVDLSYTDGEGKFWDRFRNPEGINGECAVSVLTSKTGYGAAMNQVTYTAIPEFSPLLIPLLLVALLFIVNAMQKRNQNTIVPSFN